MRKKLDSNVNVKQITSCSHQVFATMCWGKWGEVENDVTMELQGVFFHFNSLNIWQNENSRKFQVLLKSFVNKKCLKLKIFEILKIWFLSLILQNYTVSLHKFSNLWQCIQSLPKHLRLTQLNGTMARF